MVFGKIKRYFKYDNKTHEKYDLLEYSSCEYKFERSPILKEGPGQKHPGGEQLQKHNHLVSESLNLWFKMNGHGH